MDDPGAWLAQVALPAGPLRVALWLTIEDLELWRRLALEQLQITAGEPPAEVWPEGWQRRRRVLLAQIEEVRRWLERSS